jgi:phenylpropionate dioxygenase-like ring-hydroxylating dioxygenase large terminal subunit
VPVGIPQKQAFPEVVAAPENFKLTEFPCETVGQFIFVRIANEGQTLQNYLGNQFDFLLRASQGMAGIQDEFRQDVEANWKVVIENSLEGYHVPAVHAGTFMQENGMGKEESAPRFFLDDPLHSYLEHAAHPDWTIRFARMGAKVGEWPWRFEHYTHHFVFPNLTVTSFMGYSFHIQRFEPTSVDVTTVHSRTVGVEFKNSTMVGRKMMELIYAEGHEFTRKVFAEDAMICKKVKQGLKNAERLAVLAIGLEDRVRHFQQAYLRGRT